MEPNKRHTYIDGGLSFKVERKFLNTQFVFYLLIYQRDEKNKSNKKKRGFNIRTKVQEKEKIDLRVGPLVNLVVSRHVTFFLYFCFKCTRVGCFQHKNLIYEFHMKMLPQILAI